MFIYLIQSPYTVVPVGPVLNLKDLCLLRQFVVRDFLR